MKNDFLGGVTRSLISRGWEQLKNYTIVFPMSRASLFMKQHLMEEITEQGYMGPVLSPTFVTINQLVDELSGLRAEDEINAVIRMYRIFRQESGSSMPLDVFYGWGQQLLTDFSNVDMALVDSDSLFANASAAQELEKMELDPEVAERLRSLIPLQSVETAKNGVHDHFEQLWKVLPKVYRRFSDEQLAEGFGTTGARLRFVIDHFDEIETSFGERKFAFVGFNYLLAAERKLMELLQPRSSFYWDYQPDFQTNKSAYKYIAKNVVQFGNALPECPSVKEPKAIDIVASSSTNGQAQFAHEWLLAHHQPGQTSAVVIADESLLEPVIYALPDSVSERVNITKGYPLRNTKIYSDLANYLSNPKNDRKEGETYADVLRRFMAQMGEEEYAERHSEEKDTWQWSLMQEAFYQTRLVLQRFCRLISEDGLDEVKEMKTLRNLIRRHMEMVSLPFNGDPVTDIQVIGMLETRLLDFDNLLVLNVEEGVLPKKQADNSFIPYYLRKYYQMQTSDEGAEVYAYNFFRLLRRASHVTLMFSQATEGVNAKSMSRFLMQILTSREFSVRKFVLNESGRVEVPALPIIDPSLPNLMARFEADTKEATPDKPFRPKLSPSAINTFLSCRQRFYLENVLNLRGGEETAVLLQTNTLGSLIHGTIEAAYKTICGSLDGNPKVVTARQIDDFLKEEANIETALDAGYVAINMDYYRHHPEAVPDGVDYRNMPPVYLKEEHKAENLVAINHLKKVLENDKSLGAFSLCAQEKYVKMELNVPLPSGDDYSLAVGGFIDRLDVVSDGTGEHLRVLDYKSGSYNPKKMRATELGQLFQEYNKQSYILQTLIYCAALSNWDERPRKELPIMPGLLFTANSLENFDPHLWIADEQIIDYQQYADEFVAFLKKLIAEILTTEDFHPCAESDCPSYCPFHMLCGRKKNMFGQ